jgi:Na+/melibiose symporter-like transporter
MANDQFTPTRKWAFAFANAGSFVNMTLFTTFPLIFITGVLHYPISYGVAILSLQQVTTILFSLFVSAAVVEKVKMPWGKYRSWFLVVPVITFASTVLFFSPLLLHVPEKMVIPVGTLLVMGYQISVLPRGVAYNSYNRLLTSSSIERVRLTKLATQMQGVLLFICGLFVWRVIYAVGHQQSINMAGMQVIAFTYGFLNLVCYYIFFFSLKGFDESAAGVSRGGVNIFTSFKILFSNGKLASAIIGIFFCFTTETFCKVVVSFYILYVLRSPEMMANYSWAIVVTMLVGTFIAVPLVKATGSKKITLIVGFIISGLALIGAYFVVDLKIPILGLLCICLADMGVGVGRSVCVPIFGDIADEAKLRSKDGKDTTSYIMALYSLIFKFAGLVAAQASGLVGRIGFNPRSGVEPTPEILEGVRKVTTLGPACFAAVGVLIVLIFYRMDEKALKAARGEDAAPAVGH